MASKVSECTVSFDEGDAARLIGRLILVAFPPERMTIHELHHLCESMQLVSESHPNFWARNRSLQTFWDALEQEIALRTPETIDQLLQTS